MKYLKLFENIIEDMIKKEEEIKKEKDIILKLIDEYILLHEEKWSDWEELEDTGYDYAYDFTLYNYEGEKYINVEYVYDHHDDSDGENASTGLSLNDFLEFAKNPELYKDMKKYNL